MAAGDTREPWDEGPDPESVKALLDSLDPRVEPDVLVRCRVLRALEAHGGAPGVAEALVAALDPAREPSWHARAAALRTLAALGTVGPGVVEALLATLQPAREPAWYLRAAAARRLGALAVDEGGRPQAAIAGALRERLDPAREPDEAVRAAAHQALDRLGFSAGQEPDAGPPASEAALRQLVDSLPGDAATAREREAIIEAGRWLRLLRAPRMTREELAEAAGLAPEQLATLEHGLDTGGPTLGRLVDLLAVLGRDLVLEIWERPEARLVLRHRAHRPAGGGTAGTLRKAGRFLRHLRETQAAETRVEASALAETAGLEPDELAGFETGESRDGPTVGQLARLLFALGYQLTWADSPKADR